MTSQNFLFTPKKDTRKPKERKKESIMSSRGEIDETVPRTFVASSDVPSVVSSALGGLASFSPHLAQNRLEKNVVVSTPKGPRVRRRVRRQRVAVVSGGGSGHEPAMSGFTGPGFLSAAACGDVFASPSVDQISTTIDAVLEEEDIDSIVLVVMNYTGGTRRRRREEHFFYSQRIHTSRMTRPTRVLSSRLSLVLSRSDSPIDDDDHRFLYFRTRRCRAQMW